MVVRLVNISCFAYDWFLVWSSRLTKHGITMGSTNKNSNILLPSTVNMESYSIGGVEQPVGYGFLDPWKDCHSFYNKELLEVSSDNVV